MPNTCFHIGDFVWCRHGFGYIMGLQHVRTYAGSHQIIKNHKHMVIDDTTHVPWYMIGVAPNSKFDPTSEITHVVYDTNPTLFETAPPQGLSFVQSKALDFMQTDTGLNHKSHHRRFYPGDLVKHDMYGAGIILSGGYRRPERNDGQVYHHVYYLNTGIFDYDCAADNYQSINNIKLWNPADNHSRYIANQIVRDCYLMPIFSAEMHNPIAELVSTNHIDFTAIQKKFNRDYPIDRYGLS